MAGNLQSIQSSHDVRGYCALCTAHCATIATVYGGKVTALDADSDHPNGGVLCIKGKAAPELVYHRDRLNFPLKRTHSKSDADSGWQRVGWEEALDDIAARLISIRERFGARAVALAKGTRGGTSFPMPSAGWRAFSTVSEAQTGYRQLMCATGTKTQASATRSALKYRRRMSPAATPFCSGDTIQARPL